MLLIGRIPKKTFVKCPHFSELQKNKQMQYATEASKQEACLRIERCGK